MILVHARHRLADDYDRHAILTIMVAEETPLSQRDANRPEVVRADITRLRHRLLRDCC